MPVGIAPYDVAATAVGTGVTRPGESFAVLGTTLCVGTVRDDPQLDRPPNGMTLPGAAAGRWLIAYATLTGTEVLDWAAALLGLDDAAALVRLAAAAEHPAPPLVLPYLSPAGERSPFLDPDVRGTITGLDLAHRPADVARAALDGLDAGRAGLPDRRRAGRRRSRCPAAGRAATLWCQAIADAVGVPVVRPDVDEVGARGAVLVAGSDAGLLPGIDEAVQQMVRPGQAHEPDPARAAFFADAYGRFTAARDALR